MDQLVQMVERSDLEGVRGQMRSALTGKGQAWATHLSLFPVVQRVLNPPFINPHLPKMYRIIREFIPYLESDDIPPLVRLEIIEYTRRPKSTGVSKTPDQYSNVSFDRIEAAIRAGEKETAAALMQAFLEQKGREELARRLLLLGSGYLEKSLGHSISCTAFILLEMLERRDQDPWPVLGTLADYFCRGHFGSTPEMRKVSALPIKEELERHLLRATSGDGIVNLHHTITRYAVERVRHLVSEAEYAHMIVCWVEFLGDKKDETPDAVPASGPISEYDRFYRVFSKREEEPVLTTLTDLLSSEKGRKQAGRFLIKGICDLYQGDYNPHHLTGLGSALWVAERYHGSPAIVTNALRQYLNYYFMSMGT